LGNTIANIYYKFCLLTKIDYGPGWLPKYKEGEDEDVIENTIRYLQSYNNLKSDILSIPKFVDSLKQGEIKNDKKEYNYWVDFIIDCLKYDIKNIGFKTLEERIKERKEKMKQIQEIPNLIDLINV